MYLVFSISLSSEDFGLDLYPSGERPEDTVTVTDFHVLDMLDIPLFRGHRNSDGFSWT